MNPKLANATNLYMEGIRDGNAREAVTKYTGARYTQHSTGVRNGIEGFVEFFEPFIERCTHRDIQIIRSVVDGQFVFVQAFQDINHGEAKWVTTDLFDTDKSDKIIEHWDVISAYEDGDIAGTTEVAANDYTEANKNFIRDFLCDVMVLGQHDELSQYLDKNDVVIHSTDGYDLIEKTIGHYDQVFKIIGQGDFVVAYSRVCTTQDELARFDIFRLDNQKIVELWVNQEIIPPKSEWANGGKF